jgi:putative thioredoxin
MTGIDVTDETFADEVIARSNDVPVVVDFWAAWCGPCRMLTPVLEREAEQRDGVVLAKVDVDANPRVADEYRIQGIPAVKAFRNGSVVDEFVGVRSPQMVAAFLDGLTGPSELDRVTDELRADGRWPDVVAAIDEARYERALELLLERLDEDRDRVREVMVALFSELGSEHPVAAQYRRKLSTALF